MGHIRKHSGRVFYDPEALGLHVSRVAGEEALCRCYRADHYDNKPSAAFNMRTGLYYCYGCQTGSNADQIAAYTGGTVNRVPGSELPQPIKEQEDDWSWIMARPLALGNDYLKGRGVSDGLVERFQIREAEIGVAIILSDPEGRPVGAQIRKYDDSFGKYLTLGERVPYWPIEHAKRHVYVTEGIFGVFQAAKYGVDAITTLGAGVPQDNFEALAQLAPVAVFDPDFPGYVGAGKIVKHCRGKAVLGLVADEIDWSKELLKKSPTSNLLTLARLSGKKGKFLKLVNKRERGLEWNS